MKELWELNSVVNISSFALQGVYKSLFIFFFLNICAFWQGTERKMFPMEGSQISNYLKRDKFFNSNKFQVLNPIFQSLILTWAKMWYLKKKRCIFFSSDMAQPSHLFCNPRQNVGEIQRSLKVLYGYLFQQQIFLWTYSDDHYLFRK